MTAAPRRRILSRAALCAAALTLAGCETFGNPLDVMRGERVTPDEFQVLARKPLRMPGSLDLPEPQLGTRSPLEPDPQTAAIVALLGAPTVASSQTGASPGEAALLDAANAAATDPNLDNELQAREARLEEDQPYVPPSIFELFEDEPAEGFEYTINPAAEARRLQQQGLAAPIDPDDRPVQEERAPSPPTEEDFIDRVPNNRLPSAPTETAF